MPTLLLLLRRLNLRSGSDIAGTIARIEANVAMRGSALWILLCAAFLACIGLDTNSVAVIIGAMLISPLMGPVLGMGLGLSLNDFELFRRALQKLAVAALIALITSTLYFSLTPLGELTAELEANTHPTLLDVLIAFFGGVAGIIMNSRRDGGTSLPGVAIATTLMPPMCTAGYGLANLNLAIVLGAGYMFCLNAAFISLATFIITRLMRFPRRTYPETGSRRRTTVLIGLFMGLMIGPSVYFLLSVYHEEQERRVVEAVVVQPLRQQGNEILRWDIVPNDSVKQVRVYFSGRAVTASQLDSMAQTLRRRQLRARYQILASRINISKEEVAQLSEEAARGLLQNMSLQAELGRRVGTAPTSGNLPSAAQLLREVRTTFPGVTGLSLNRARPDVAPDSLLPDTLLTVSVAWQRPRAHPSGAEAARLYRYLQVRLQQDSLGLRHNELRAGSDVRPQPVRVQVLPPAAVPAKLRVPTPAARRGRE